MATPLRSPGFKTLPTRLQRFFAHYPPSSTSTSSSSSTETTAPPNPFLPHRSPKTQSWHPPIYSLRRQAELVKLAHSSGVEALLPPSVKASGGRSARRAATGLRVQGTGVGSKVKGHAWERLLKGKLEKRRAAMLDMPRLVQEWKQRGHGRGWKKWPSGKAK